MNEEIAPDSLIPYLREEYALEAPLACSLIRRGFNDSYLVESSAGKFVFRIYFRDKYYIDSIDDFRWELAFLAHLQGCNIPVCSPIARKNGDTLGSFADSAGPRSAALFSFIGAESPNKQEEHAARLGDIAARLHRAADTFSTSLARYHLDLRYLTEEPLRLIDEFLREQGRAGVDIYRPAVAEQESLIRAIGREAPVYGPIHGDLHRGNVLIADDGSFALIDFDHGGYGWRAYDIASCTGGMAEPAWQAFIAAYERVRSLEEVERSAIAAFRKVRPLWDLGDVLAMRKAWDNFNEFGSDFANKIEATLAKCFGDGEAAKP
jgi:Ser/Thr protein kinase RdoA (MazF antagonist)